MPIIATKIVIGNKEEPVPSIKNEEKVQVKVSAPPVVTIQNDVAIVDYPDFIVEKTSPYVSHMSNNNK